METRKRILLIDFANFEDFPIGGYLTFAKNMMSAFKGELALAGITTSAHDPVGRWFKKSIKGIDYDFFAMARYNSARIKKIIPDRLVNYLLLNIYKYKILSIGIDNVFMQRPESLIAVACSAKNICYSFAGLDNPLVISKYSYAGLLATWFDSRFFKKIGFAKAILARGDEAAINEMLARSNGSLSNHTIVKFPTRIDTEIFNPVSMKKARADLNLPEGPIIVVTTGRLAWWKGWKFMIDSFRLFAEMSTDAILILVGAGEDYNKIMSYISENSLADKVLLTGRKSREEIALYLNASDLYIMGSYKEGWPTALMEAIACGVPACTTEFSSVSDIILHGQNGYIIRNRNEEEFSHGMKEALKLTRPVQNEHVTRYSTSNLKEDLLKYWEIT